MNGITGAARVIVMVEIVVGTEYNTNNTAGQASQAARYAANKVRELVGEQAKVVEVKVAAIGTLKELQEQG